MSECNTVEFCPVCQPMSYYAGKTGMPEVEAAGMCDHCWSDLGDLMAYMQSVTGDPSFTECRWPSIQDKDHAAAIHAFLAGSDLPYVLHEERAGAEWKIEKLCGVPLRNDELTTLRDRVQELEAQVPRWVSVDEALPPEDDMVLARFSAGGLCECAICYWDSVAGWFEVKCDDADLVDNPPTHWMPLPTPPEDSSDE